MQGRSSIRLAAMVGVIAPGFESCRFILNGLEKRAWQGEHGGLFILPAVLGPIAILFAVCVVWFFGYPLIQFAAHVVHSVVGRQVPIDAWEDATDQGLSVVPYAAVLGVVTWLTYSIGKFAAWPGDLMFGTIGNFIGAWCYLSLFGEWFNVIRHSRTPE